MLIKNCLTCKFYQDIEFGFGGMAKTPKRCQGCEEGSLWVSSMKKSCRNCSFNDTCMEIDTDFINYCVRWKYAGISCPAPEGSICSPECCAKYRNKKKKENKDEYSGG